MSLVLKVIAGPLKDKKIPVKAGLTFGRQGAEIELNDGKVSSIHARIVENESGSGFILTDNNSKNGVRVDGERVPYVELKPGTVFYIGDSGFKVKTIAAPGIGTDAPPEPKSADIGAMDPTRVAAKPAPEVIAEVAPPPPKPAKKGKYWYEALSEFIREHGARFRDKPKPLMPLEPALVLDFVKGVQADAKWVVGFGPRKVGAASLDLPIWEPGAPDVCFEILPSQDGLVFKTAHPDKVRLNGEKVDSRTLRMGDTISILETLIEVDFTE